MDQNLLIDCAKNMWAFPLIGALIGLIAGFFGWIFLHFLPILVVGPLTLAVLLWMTGLHHTDGLLDFGDGIMAHGTPEHKIAIMHDRFTGAGAIGLCLMTYVITAFAFSSFNQVVSYWDLMVPLIFPAIIVIELCAKLSMVLSARVGKSVHEGMNTNFLKFMHGNGGIWRLFIGLTISFIISIILLGWAGLFSVFAALITGLVMVAFSNRHFRGVTGDVFGATNEIARMICSIVLLAVILW